MAGQFEIFGDGTGFRFRLTGQDNEVLAVSGLFASKVQVAGAVMAVREHAATGHIIDCSAAAPGESAGEARGHRGSRRRPAGLVRQA